MAGEPDVRVRLTPEGLSEVLAAFKKIQAEAGALQKKTAQPAAGGKGFLGGLGEAITRMRGGLSGVASMLGTGGIIGSAVAAAALGFAALATNVGDAAEQTQNFASTSGLTIENLQALQLMARENAIDQGRLHAAIVKTGDAIADLRDGLPEATKRFAALGLAAKDFDGKDVAESIQIVARALKDLPPEQRLRALKEIFGDKRGALGAFMDELANSSLPEAIARYKELGILLDAKVVKSAAKVGNEFEKVQAQAQSMATLFVSSAGPGVVTALTEILEVVAENKDLIAQMGRIFGAVVAPAATLALIPIRAIATEIGIAVEAAAALAGFFAELGKATISGDQKGLEEASKRLGAALDPRKHIKVVDDAAKGILDVFTQITKGPKALTLPEDPEDRATAKASAEAVFREREAFLKASADRELAIIRARNRVSAQENQRAFDEGLRSLTTYFAERRAILEDESREEIRGINLRIALAQQDPALTPAQRTRTVDDLESRRLAEQLEFIQKSEELKNQEISQRRQFAQRLLQVELSSTTDLKRLHELKIAEINAEAVELERTLIQLGEAPEVAERARIRFSNEKIGKFQFADRAQDAERELADLSAARAQIEEEVAAGLSSQTQGESRILALERDRLPVLQEIADELIEMADRTRDPISGIGDEEMIAQAQAFADAIGEVGVSIQASEFSLQKMKAAAIDAAKFGLVDVLVSTADGFDAVGEAALRAADQVASALQRMAAEALATELFNLIPGFSKGGSVSRGGSSQLKRLPIFGGDGHATGGPVHGPGTGTSDSIPAWLSAGEYVQPSATVRVPGVLQHLEALRRVRTESDFRRTIATTTQSAGGRFAEGGHVRGPGTGTSDSIPAWLSAGEYVQPAATVRVPGVLPHLEALRRVRTESDFRRTIATTFTRADVESAVRGMNARVPSLSEFMPRYAEGGLVGVGADSFRDAPQTQAAASPASSRLNGRIDVNVAVAEGLTAKVAGSMNSEDHVMRVIAKNPRAIRRHLGL